MANEIDALKQSVAATADANSTQLERLAKSIDNLRKPAPKKKVASPPAK